jgi:hypothetical protein
MRASEAAETPARDANRRVSNATPESRSEVGKLNSAGIGFTPAQAPTQAG